MQQVIKKWYEGEFDPARNDPHTSFWMVGSVRRHWTARLARWAIDFYMREWKWVLGTAGAVIVFFFFK
jgi:hypothetical protein